MTKSHLQGFAFDFGTPVQGNGFAVFAHAHQVVTKIGFVALLGKVQRRHGAANPVADQAATQGVGQGHPDHETRNLIRCAIQCEAKATREVPQNANEAQQRHACIQQTQRQAHGVGGELLHVFLNALVGVVGAAL